MNSQNNQYEKLLHYLESQLPAKEIVLEEIASPIRKQANGSANNIIKKNPLEGIYSDVTQGIPNVFSRGFDVNKFESAMRNKLIEEHEKLKNYERPYISVTELFYCLRQTYYKRKKYEIDTTKQFNFSYLYLINKVGNTIHDVIQNLYEHTEIEKTVISEKYKVKGRVDGIKENIVLEYKTIDETKFDGNYILTHYLQGLIYSYILNTEYGYNIDTITIVYISRNLKRIVPFDLPVDNDKAIHYLELAYVLKKCLDSNIVPDTINSDEEQCKWCSYKEYCKNEKTTPESLKPKNKPVFLL